MAIVTIEPPNELKQVIRQFWYTSVGNSNENTETYKILPDGAPGLIFQHSNGNSSVFDKDHSRLPTSFVYGQITNTCINHIEGTPFILGVNFQASALRTLFSINASELTNSFINTEYFLSKQFNDQLLNTSNPHNIIQLLSEKLSQHLSKHKKDKIIDESIFQIMQKTIEIDSKILSSYFNISRRQFQRRFKESVGVSPETYLRIIKFQKSIHLLRNKQYDKLSDISYEFNYADQSHFNREFKMFSGFKPKEFLKKNETQQPFYQNNKQLFEPLRIVRY